ncbi:hypothetical protein BLOT_008867 [Blomia tropicalis]|nr:hypothetical protein BLOT_008867 [Blomia tropicalis]
MATNQSYTHQAMCIHASHVDSSLQHRMERKLLLRSDYHDPESFFRFNCYRHVLKYEFMNVDANSTIQVDDLISHRIVTINSDYHDDSWLGVVFYSFTFSIEMVRLRLYCGLVSEYSDGR